MDEKTKKLVAIGASVTAHCAPCLEHHLAEAREAGLSDCDIKEAIKVGRTVRRGAASAWDKTANTLISNPTGPGSETPHSAACCAG